jgi:hypothetical protein
MFYQVGLNSPISNCSSTKVDDKQHVISMPNVRLPSSSPPAAACSSDTDGAATSAASAFASKRRSNIKDSALHRWAMDEAAGIIEEQQQRQAECDIRNQRQKRDKERECTTVTIIVIIVIVITSIPGDYVDRILLEAMQRHLRAQSPPSGNLPLWCATLNPDSYIIPGDVLPARTLEIKGAVMSDAETNPHAAGAFASHVTRHTSHVTRHTSHTTRHPVMEAARVYRSCKSRQIE